MFEIISLTSGDARYAAVIGPHLGSPVLAAELDGEVADRPGKTWYALVPGGGGDGRAVGFCGAIDPGDGGPVVLETFWLDGSLRGQGWGHKLLAAALAAYPGRALQAWCSADSRRLFAAAGFTEVGWSLPGAVPWWAEVVREGGTSEDS